MLPAITVQFTLNGENRTVSVPPERLVTDLLREDLGLMGTKLDCAEGECGACTVIFNGQPACSCLMTAAQLQAAHLVTVEGIAHSLERPHEVQRAFVSEGAVQCGHCIPGMIVSAAALLRKNPHPAEGEIRLAIAGNICRCTGYTKIVRAIERAAEMMAEGKVPNAVAG